MLFDGEKVIFATTDPAFALSMSYGSGDVLAASYALNKNTCKKEFFLDELKPNSLKLLENPASLYVVDSKNFQHDSRLLPEELISKKEINIIEEIIIKNVFKKIKGMGANIIAYGMVLDSMKNRGKDPGKSNKRYKADRFKK